MSGPRIDLPPLMVNVRPSELADSTTIGREPHGMTTRCLYASWCLRGQTQKLMPGRWREQFEHLDLELPLPSAVLWTRARDEKQLRAWLERLRKPFGMLPKYPTDKVAPMQEPVLLDYEVRRGLLWYRVDRYYLQLPNSDRLFLQIGDFVDALGDRVRFREFLRGAAEVGEQENRNRPPPRRRR